MRRIDWASMDIYEEVFGDTRRKAAEARARIEQLEVNYGGKNVEPLRQLTVGQIMTVDQCHVPDLELVGLEHSEFIELLVDEIKNLDHWVFEITENGTECVLWKTGEGLC